MLGKLVLAKARMHSVIVKITVNGRETHAERQCVVGWFREYHEERVPDLDWSSLHTRDSDIQICP